jgi:hypothetical protein
MEPSTPPRVKPQVNTMPRMGLASYTRPAPPVIRNIPVHNQNLMETRVLGAFNTASGKGWVETDRKAKRTRRNRKSRKSRKSRR